MTNKLQYQITEMIHNGTCWIGINTGIPNHIVEEAIKNNTIKALKGYTEIKREVRYGENSRIDILLRNNFQTGCPY